MFEPECQEGLYPLMDKMEKINGRYILSIFEYLLIILLISFLLAACHNTPKDNIKELEQRGERCFLSGDYIGAVKEWSKLIQGGKADAYIYEQTGLAQKKLGNLPAALDAFSESVRLDPRSMSAWEQKAALEIFFADVPAAAASLKSLEKLGRSSVYYILRGDLLCIQGQYSSAEEQYRTVLSKEPENETALARLAFCLMSDGRKDESLTVYKKLAALPHKRPESLAFMGRYWFIMGHPEQTESLLSKAAAMDPDNLELQVKLAGFYIDSMNYSKAHAVFARILAKNPSNIFARKMLIETSMLAGDLDGASKELSALSPEDKKDLEYSLLEGKFFLLQHNLPQAISYFQQAIEQEPNLVVGHYLLGITYLSMGHGNLGKSALIKALSLDRTFADAELALAAFFYKKEKYDVAEEYARRVQEKEPANYKAFLILGSIYMVREQEKMAAEMFRTAKALNPDLVIPDYYGAMIANKVLPFDKTVRLYRTLLDKCPFCIDVLYDYAMLLVKNGQKDAAFKIINSRIEHDPDNPWLYCVFGEICQRIGEREHAVELFIKAAQIDPGMTFAYNRLISLMSSRGHDKKRIENILAAAVKNNLMVPEIYLTLADIYFRTGRHKQAVQLLEDAKQKMPGNPDIANNLAWYYLMPATRDVSRAFEIVLSLNEQFPERSEIMDTLAWVYYFKGLYTQAHWLLEACMEKGEDNPIIYFHVGMVYAAEGRTSEARKYLLLAKEKKHNIPYIVQNLEKIDRTLQKIAEEEDAQKKQQMN